MKLREEREQRGLLYQFSDEKLFDLYDKGGQKFYVWFDPSADSLQLGNMCAIMAAVNLMKYGNKCYFLVGGATGMIGDPSGKNEERNFLWEEKLRHNEQRIYAQLTSFLEHLQRKFDLKFDYEMVNNYDFYKDMSYLRFLSEVGKYITVNTMISKESVKKRIEDPEKSISYAEFSYMLIQGYDFVHLFEKEDVKLQLGGSDQRGNVVTGIEIIRKKFDKEAFALTIPLITDSTGKKFWKSEGNSIRLDNEKTSPYFVYQYFMNANDEDLEQYLKILTLLDFDQIEKIITEHKKKPEARHGQKELAKAVIEIVFDKDVITQASKISEILFSEGDKMWFLKEFKPEDIDALYKETWGVRLEAWGIEGWFKVLDLFTQAWLTSSNGEAKKMITQWALFCNETKVKDPQKTFNQEDFINGILLLRKGKKQFKIVKII